MSSGNEFTVFDIPGEAKVGVLICYDKNLIENAQITALMSAEILVAPHQTGVFGTTGKRARLRSRPKSGTRKARPGQFPP
jgi:apolipoprotein N-acyltransferase